jgi:hypothetical protein
VRIALFGDFVGTTRLSDFLRSFIEDSRHIDFSSRSTTPSVVDDRRTSRFSREMFPNALEV